MKHHFEIFLHFDVERFMARQDESNKQKKWKHEKCGLAEKKNIEKVIKFSSLIKIDYFEYHLSN